MGAPMPYGAGVQRAPQMPGMRPLAGTGGSTMPPGYAQMPGGIAAPGARPGKQGPPRREMDSLLEELKAKQRMQEQKKEFMKSTEATSQTEESAPAFAVGGLLGEPRAANCGGGLPLVGRSPPVHDGSLPPRGSTEGTALFLRELPASATEDGLCQLFTRYGIVTAMDIVRPLDKTEKTSGYITLDTRENAQRAKEALHDREVDGVPLWIEWAKGPPPVASSDRSDPAIDSSKSKDGTRHLIVEPPEDKRRRRVIDRLAKYVAQEGHPFEQIVMERESPDGTFKFLFQHDSKENIYYRWRTFAFAQGDNFKVWRTETFRICEGGAWWRPPLCETVVERKSRSTNFSSAPPAQGPPSPAAVAAPATTAPTAAVVPAKPTNRPQAGPLASWTQADVEEEAERQRLEERATQERQKRDRDKKGIAGGKRLTDTDWDKLELLLRSITVMRCTVLEAMVFCLDKSDWAIEITECLTESLSIVETELPLKLARLMLVSDILHNTCSSRPAAWAYRREFEKSLPDIFEHFYVALSRVESRLAADKTRHQVNRLLHIWEDWGLFAPQFVRGLEAALCVGVKHLQLLAAKGDNSREPTWLEPKLADWRRQHFSQLEKMCRMRGLRSSTSHLEGSKEVSLEEARKEWLIDRLVAYELHWHDKKQTKTATPVALPPKAKSSDDLDGEAIECEIDGFALDEAELDGEPLSFADASELRAIMEIARLTPDAGPGGFLGDGPCGVNGSAAHRSGEAAYGGILNGGIPLQQTDEALGSDEVVAVVLSSTGAQAASSTMASPAASQEAVPGLRPVSGDPASANHADAGSEDSDEVLEIDTPQERPASNPMASGEAAGEAPKTDSKIDSSSLRHIELEVMEMRASLETQGLHRDAIEDICEEKRQRLTEEHEASLASPARRESEPRVRMEENDDSSDTSMEQVQKEKEKEKGKERAKEKDRDKRKREEERTKEDRSKEKVKRKRSAKDKDDNRDKDKEVQKKHRSKSHGADMAKVKARGGSPTRAKKDKAKERSRSRDRAKKTRR